MGVGVSIDDVRAITADLERSYEVVVRDRVKFRVGRIVYLALSRDETMMGFAFPKDQRAGLVAGEPHKFLLPKPGDMRYQWAVVRLSAIDEVELRELVEEAWSMVVPKKLRSAYFAGRGVPDDPR
ncbi:MAG: MmcQ/YjbR family DNA-binding protein [Actinomycetota bacterium]|nr:MmcQ/YjbR family DNA-binding protein [Actinomycetota bacterium]